MLSILTFCASNGKLILVFERSVHYDENSF